MAYQKGSDMLLKVDSTGGGVYQTVAGLQTKAISFSGEIVDVTNSDSANKFRELLTGAGIKSCQITGKGVFDDSAAQNTIVTYFHNGTIRNWQCVAPTLGTWTGAFQISSLKISGEHKGEVSFEITLESANETLFAAS